jgi:hypothetical protein
MRGATIRKPIVTDAGAESAPAVTIELKPAKGRLLPHVESYYLFRCGEGELEGPERVDIGHIRFLIRGEGEMTFPDGHVEPLKPIMVRARHRRGEL